jgi:hypothetical protein
VAQDLQVPDALIPKGSVSGAKKRVLIEAIREAQRGRIFKTQQSPTPKQRDLSSASSSASASASASLSDEYLDSEIDKIMKDFRPRLPEEEEYIPQGDFSGVAEPMDDEEEDVEEEVDVGRGRRPRSFKFSRFRKTIIPKGGFNDSRNDFFKIRKMGKM